MFIRKTEKPNGNKKYFCYQLVESYRTPKGPRQRILLSLGASLPLDKQERKLLANRIEDLLNDQQSFFKLSDSIESLAHLFYEQLIHKELKKTDPYKTPKTSSTEVQLSTVEHEDCREVGIATLACKAFTQLNFPSELQKMGLTKRQAEVAVGIIVHRLAHAGSEKYAHEWLKQTSALDEITNCSFKNLSQKTVYNIGDKLLEIKDELENYLEKKEEDLFNIQDTLFLYDLTNTYFEGSKTKSLKAHHGRSKEKRSDCPLITLGLMINQKGFIKKSHIFEGNISEPKTLKTIIDHLIDSRQNSTLVMDAGIATQENLDFLKQHNISYITVSRQRPKFDLSDGETFQNRSGNDIKAKLISDKTTGELLLYCHSQEKEKKERSIESNQKQSFEKALETVKLGIHKKRGIKKYEKVIERIGRIKEKFKKISHFYKITINQKLNIATEINWEYQEDKAKNKFRGTYLLRSHGLNLSAQKLWETYMTLAQIEESFRAMKSELGLRPIYHQKETRIDAHLFITVLAYHMMHTIRYQLKQAGIKDSWETICKHFSNYMRITTQVQTKEGDTIRVRSTVKPTAKQFEIFQALSLPHDSNRIIINH